MHVNGQSPEFTPTGELLSEGKLCTWSACNTTSVVRPLIPWLLNHTLHHHAAHLRNLYLYPGRRESSRKLNHNNANQRYIEHCLLRCVYADQSEQRGGEALKRLELKLGISDRRGIQCCSGNNEKGHPRTLARLILSIMRLFNKKAVLQYLFAWWRFNSEVNWCFLPWTQKATREETISHTHITRSPWGDYSSWLPYTSPCMQST